MKIDLGPGPLNNESDSNGANNAISTNKTTFEKLKFNEKFDFLAFQAYPRQKRG